MVISGHVLVQINDARFHVIMNCDSTEYQARLPYALSQVVSEAMPLQVSAAAADDMEQSCECGRTFTFNMRKTIQGQ